MLKKIVLLINFSLVFSNLYAYEYINYGKFKDDTSIFKQNDVVKLSEKFLDIDYVSNTLTNEQINTSKENLIINFNSLDCFTFIDTIQALRESNNKMEFRQNLIDTRYKDGNISYFSRNHFFSDWKYYNDINDITCNIGECEKTIKYLNQDEKYLKKIPTIKREIAFINPQNIDITKLKNGDYVGIYTQKKALDVTHTGIIIKKLGKVFIRHASSLQKKIIDSDFFEYTKNKVGVIIYRPVFK